jgi:hypothetical protein
MGKLLPPEFGLSFGRSSGQLAHSMGHWSGSFTHWQSVSELVGVLSEMC